MSPGDGVIWATDIPRQLATAVACAATPLIREIVNDDLAASIGLTLHWAVPQGTA